MNGLFENLKVIDLASFVAGPCAATIFADFGADVIKVEAPGGDGYRRLHGNYPTDYNWNLTSRGKRGIVLDIGTRHGREVLSRMLISTDVLLTNFRDDQLKKYALDYESLRQDYPALICAQLTGYGNTGPEKHRRGYDASAWWARSGMMQLMASTDGDPVFPAGGVGDHSAGMTLFASIMMALYRRQITGEGGMVETSLMASGIWSNGMAIKAAIAGFDIHATIKKHGSRNPFYSVYRTLDNKHIVLVLTNAEKEWPQLAAILGHTEWLEDGRFADMQSIMNHMPAFRTLLSVAFAERTLEDLTVALDSQQLTFGIAKSPMEVVTDPHAIEAGFLVETKDENPHCRLTIPSPIRINNQRQRPPEKPPKLGEHTNEILEELGYSAEAIEQLIASGGVFNQSH